MDSHTLISRRSAGASRRDALMFVAGLPALALAASGSSVQAQAPAQVCFNEAELPRAQRSMRQALEFQVKSSDPAKVCGGCAFFHPTAGQAGCGKCDILSGQVTSQGVCTSWAKKPG